MGFNEEVATALSNMLAQKILTAEGNQKRIETEQKQCIQEAAQSKLDLLVVRRVSLNPGLPDRVAKENSLRDKINDARDRHDKATKELETIKADLQMYQGIKADAQKGALQLTA